MRAVLACSIYFTFTFANAQACFQTMVMAPTPLMGNHGEIFRTAEGAVFEVSGSYEYLYAYYPNVTICPDRGKMLVEGTTIGIRSLSPATSPSRKQGGGKDAAASTSKPTQKRRSGGAPIEVVLRVTGCDYFIADGPNGYYVLEWYGGYDPDEGDGIFGEIRNYGFKDVIYGNGRDGRVYVDDYALSQDGALETLREQCN